MHHENQLVVTGNVPWIASRYPVLVLGVKGQFRHPGPTEVLDHLIRPLPIPSLVGDLVLDLLRGVELPPKDVGRFLRVHAVGREKHLAIRGARFDERAAVHQSKSSYDKRCFAGLAKLANRFLGAGWLELRECLNQHICKHLVVLAGLDHVGNVRIRGGDFLQSKPLLEGPLDGLPSNVSHHQPLLVAVVARLLMLRLEVADVVRPHPFGERGDIGGTRQRFDVRGQRFDVTAVHRVHRKGNVRVDPLAYDVRLLVARALPRKGIHGVLAKIPRLARPQVPPVVVVASALVEVKAKVCRRLRVVLRQGRNVRLLLGVDHVVEVVGHRICWNCPSRRMALMVFLMSFAPAPFFSKRTGTEHPGSSGLAHITK